MARMIKLGRTATEGSVWDEGGKSDIVKIHISHEQDSIKSLQFTYNSNGVGSLSELHGEHNGSTFNTIILEHPHEFLTSISGKYLNGKVVSLVFGTNYDKKFGPFGKTGSDDRDTEEFNYEFGPMDVAMMECGFGGFHGSFLNGNLNSIGVYVKPF